MKRLLLPFVLLLAMAGSLAGPTPAPAADNAAGSPTPLFAYYYIWFTPSSWSRGKIDTPLLGRYSSDDSQVMRQHVRWAKSAGITGFLVSWKSTPALDDRLARLIQVADAEHFRLGIVYEGLDFHRRPLPIATVRHDLERFARTFARNPAFAIFDHPVVIWSGTWRYTNSEIRSVTQALHGRVLVLASAKNVDDYERVAPLVDGDAYYWSSVNPGRYKGYPNKLRALSAAVHARNGLWIAPAAPGFDSRLIGGTSIVPRNNGSTLLRELNAATSSSPDAIGVISWNEFSENTFVEPSRAYGSTALKVIADVRHARAPEVGNFDSDGAGTSTAAFGISYGIIGLAAGCAGLIALTTIARRRRRPPIGPVTKEPSPPLP
ncbi:MAG TPA: endo-1,3-alpha-glucanase family glycosylhydrolase [Gaiellales bacterium]|nr:endo-1,3-alpha-glucanase family glycosylhydrolase [Gaiellales bacterium]